MMTNPAPLPTMKKITEEAVLEEYNKTNTKGEEVSSRKCFHNNSGIQENKKGGGATFSVFVEFAKIMFEARFDDIHLRFSSEYKNYYSYIKESQIPKIRKWEEEQRRRVFLRDCLSLSIALELIREENQNGKFLREDTPIGELEELGKHGQNEDAIKRLAEAVVKEINDLPFYKDATLVCAVPSHKDKGFDLPRDVTALVSEKIGKQDVTEGFVFAGQKSSVTTSSVDKKWGVWEKADISFDISKFDVEGKTIVLIDDKYQSGRTIQHVAMKLQKAGASQIYGLCFVKTWSNTDNVR